MASVVINEGEEPYATNMSQMCFNNSVKAKGEEPLTNVQWRQVVEKNAYRGRITICTWDVGMLSPMKKQSKGVSRAG